MAILFRNIRDTRAALKTVDYYLQMMIAWFYATALAFHWQDTLSYLQDRRLPRWVHCKTLQKACERHRLTSEQKAVLRGLRYE